MLIAGGILAVPLAVALWVAWVMAGIHLYASKTVSGKADAAIVLGAAEYNNRPSPVFRERINHAINLYKEGRVRLLILTGGAGAGSPYTEAEVARDYAVKHGVPAEDIRIEDVSRITYDNLREARRIVKHEGAKRVFIVSDPLHMKRAVTMARDLGLDAYPSPTPTTLFKTWKTKRPFLFRETYYLCLYRLGRPLLRAGAE
jgi:uncharacterized SAM-binding protein YcdF (DUF218 family)